MAIGTFQHISHLHEVVERVKIGHPLVGEDKQLVVSLLQHCHALAVDLKLLSMELNLQQYQS